MADSNRLIKGPALSLAPARSDDGAADSDILERAVAILSQESSYLHGSSEKANPAIIQPLVSRSFTAPGLEQLRQSAVEAVTTLLAAAGTSTNQSAQSLGIPWRRDAEAIRAGENARVALTIDNAGDRPVPVTFYSTDLIGDSGYQIPAHLISFDPPSQLIPPRSRAATRMNVAVPLQTLAGSYSALVQALGSAAVKAVVTLEVL